VRREVPRVALILMLSVGMVLEVSAIGQAREQAGNTKQITLATGPLRVSQLNPRYFSDESGRPIYLTGFHGGSELQDNAWGDDEGGALDYGSFLDLLVSYNLNFIRMWVVETTRLHDRQMALATPMPYQRTGPGSALVGNLKFDLRQFNPAYFDRLRTRVMAARDRGIYVMVMLFQGFSIETKGGLKQSPWPGHPFHSANNVNGINGDGNGNGEGEEVHSLKIPAITRLQEAYVRQVIDTLNDLDNVLYEIANESHSQSTAWQYHMVRYIHDYEKRKAKQHPVIMTAQFPNGENSVLFKSPAEAISPTRAGGYGDEPPTADGMKIIINDTDHVATKSANHMWVWKSFLRGLNPILLWNPEKAEIPKWELTRRNLGYTRRYAQRINLATMVPRDDLASSGYCLAQPGVAYLAYLPYGRSISVDLRAAKGSMKVEWFSPSTGETLDAGTIEGGARKELTSPFMRRFTVHWMRRNFDGVLRTLGVDKPAQTGDSVIFLTASEATSQP
jgi:hypothetical protein